MHFLRFRVTLLRGVSALRLAWNGKQPATGKRGSAPLASTRHPVSIRAAAAGRRRLAQRLAGQIFCQDQRAGAFTSRRELFRQFRHSTSPGAAQVLRIIQKHLIRKHILPGRCPQRPVAPARMKPPGQSGMGSGLSRSAENPAAQAQAACLRNRQ